MEKTDEPPPYENSFSDTNPSSSRSLTSINDKKSFRSAAPLERDSSPSSTRTSVFSLLRDVFRRRPHRDEDPPDTPVESTVMDNVCTLVRPYTDSAADRVALLERCVELCTRHKLALSVILQKKFIQDHTALYWAIINGPWPPRPPFALVAAVLAHSAPLTPETMQDARRACVALKSQEMLRFLRSCSEFGALSVEDQFLLGARVPPEEIFVEHMQGDTQPFSVNFTIPMFLKRMALGRDIKLEFIARGRLWQLSFFTAVNPTQRWLKNGAWCTTLSVAESSLSAHAAFGLVFLDARPSPPSGPRHFWASGESDDSVDVRGEPGHGVNVYSWQIFGDDSVCIASNGSISGVLGSPVALAKPAGRMYMYRALYDFVGQAGEMSLKKDDLAELIEQNPNGWWLMKKDGVEGWAPSNYLEFVHAPEAVSPPRVQN